MTRESIDKLARRLAASLPQSLLAVRDDVEQNFRAVLKSSLARMDLVTREEFEVQELVLARTREKLAALEKRVASYEQAPGNVAEALRKAGDKPAVGEAGATGRSAGPAATKARKKPGGKTGKKKKTS